MAIIHNINYGDLIFSERYKLDQKAYSNYYDSCDETVLTYNSWYGSNSHKKLITPLLRKEKLKKLEKLKK